MRRERAFAKVNLVLHVGPRRPDGLHELCSLFASIDLADEIELEEAAAGEDRVVCPAVAGENLAARALAAYREAAGGELPSLEVRIHKRIPVAGGLGGGSADAAAVLRAANDLAGRPLAAGELGGLAARLGADVPSQLQPGHALVTGAGERVEPVELPPLALVLVSQLEGLRTADVYAQFDRLGLARSELDPEALRELAAASPERLAAGVENDLQAAALSLRPELEDVLAELVGAGASGTLVAGSGPTCCGVFTELGDAQLACSRIEDSLVAVVRR